MNLVKSKQRVADHGEVFTPAWMVEAMLDLVKDETERIDSRFLEPACGSGNFLVRILQRKLAAVQLKYGKSDFERRHYTLLSHRENLTSEARQSLKVLLAANKRLHTAYLLKESFDQLWDYEREGWARRFFENWRASLKWQRLKPYEKFAALIDRHWDGIAAYCQPENKVSLGFVEGLNNKIRVIQRRAYGLRDEEYLRLKILTCMLPPL